MGPFISVLGKEGPEQVGGRLHLVGATLHLVGATPLASKEGGKKWEGKGPCLWFSCEQGSQSVLCRQGESVGGGIRKVGFSVTLRVKGQEPVLTIGCRLS